MKAPQIILVALYLVSLGITLGNHGQPKKGNHDFGATLLATIIVMSLLYWGGFFAA